MPDCNKEIALKQTSNSRMVGDRLTLSKDKRMPKTLPSLR